MKRILVVDNHPVILKFMQNLLEKKGHRVLTAKDGLSALEILKTFMPDICFIDLVMENISGDKLCRIIRDSPKFNNTFIVILSAIAAEEAEDVNKYHADTFIAKGPLNKMAGHVLQVLELLDTPEGELLKGKVLGRDEVYARDITRELLASRKHYEITLNHISEGFLELSNSNIVYVNPAAVSLIGVSEEKLLASDITELFSKEDGKKIRTMLESAKNNQTPIGIDDPVTLNNNSVLVKIVPIHEEKLLSVLVILGDVSRQKQLEDQLQHAKRMEAIGTLAGGVAHDLNNVLSGIVSYPDFLLRQLPEESPFRKPIMTIKKSGEKAATIVQDLLTLARRGIANMEVVSLNDIITDYLKSPELAALRNHHEKITLEVRFQENLLNSMGSVVNLSKAVMNLMSNGMEAIADDGKVVITTENKYIDKSFIGYEKMDEGEYVAVTISDSGMGISDKDLERIFEPFYSKKELGRSGTGLGMAVVWGVIKDHNGYIDIKSSIGTGTAITVYLPATRQQIMEDIDPASINDFMGNDETILIIDDIKEQREIASTLLTSLGYKADAVSGGEKAIEFLKNDKVDLVILDMIMNPGMDGLETYKNIIKIHPGQKAILVSGFSETKLVRQAQALGAGPYIQKPYTMEKIGHAVKTELNCSSKK